MPSYQKWKKYEIEDSGHGTERSFHVFGREHGSISFLGLPRNATEDGRGSINWRGGRLTAIRDILHLASGGKGHP